MADVAFEFDT